MTQGDWSNLAVALLIFLIPIIYFSGKLVGKFETIITRLTSLEGKVESFKDNCFTKIDATTRMQETDRQRQTQQNSIDWLRKITMKLCFKAGVNPEEET